jgi:putative hemolysin
MLDFFIVCVCLITNALFSAYEMAFVTISKEDISDLYEAKSTTSRKLARFKRKPERTLSVIQIGITLVGAVAAAVGGTGAVESLEPYIVQQYGLSQTLAQVIAVTLVILPLTYFSVVFGELLPKAVALRHPKTILLFGTKALGIIDRFFSPVITLLEISTDTLLRFLRLHDSNVEEDGLPVSIDIGNLRPYHQKFVQNLVDLKGKRVTRSLIPWSKVSYLNFADTEEEARQKINSTHFSRFPVIDGETLVGILHIKELSEMSASSHSPWQSILRPAVRVKNTEKALEAFIKIQEKHQHLAVVLDEQENYIGIVTMEDILEEIVGDIQDDLD